MKRITLFVASLLALLFAASCQQETLEPAQTGATVTFTVEVPEVATKGIGDDVSNINDLVYAVYRTTAETKEAAVAAMDQNYLVYRVNPDATTFVNGKTNVTLELVNDQNFLILFWAQNSDSWVKGTEFDLTNVTCPDKLSGNNNNYAAFSGVSFVKKVDGARAESVTLTRPFAQINIATIDPVHFDVTVSTTAVKVVGAGASFNVAKQEAEGTTTVEFAAAAKPSAEAFEVNSNKYAHYLAMNYVFANGNVDVTYDIATENHGVVNNTVPEVPVAANYRTNIIGNLLTADADYTVELDKNWGTPEKEYEIWDGRTLSKPTTNAAGEYVVNKPSEWAYLANQQNPATKADPVPVVINLTSNLDFGGNALTGLVAATNNSLTVNGNGYTIMNAKVISGTVDNGTSTSALFISYSNSVLNVKNLDIKNVNVVTDENPDHGYAGVVGGYIEGTVNLENVNVYSSTVHSTQSIGGVFGFIPANGVVIVKNCIVDGVKLTNADVEGESGSMGGFVGRVAGKLTAENVKVSDSTIEAYVGTASEQKRSIAKFIGNFVGGGSIAVTGASLENVTIVAKNELAQTQSCLYTEYLGGWRGNGGTVSINGVVITKDQTNEEIIVDTPAELTTAISNATDGAVIPVSGNISTNSLSASGKSITIVGMSDDATINSASSRMETYGNITFQNVTINLPTNNDYYGGQDAHNAQIVYDNCKFVGTATAINGTFVYNDCEFTNPDKYAAWVYNGNVTYNNCSFTGKDRAAKVYAEAGNAPVVTYNNCTFNASQSVNKTAVEIDCTNQTSGTPYYVTIINPTINNMGVAEHYAVGADGICNLETSGKGLGIVNLNGKSYSVASTAAQLQALAYAVKEDMGVTTVEVAAGTYSDDITLTVAAAGKTATGNLVFKAAEGATPVIAGTVTLGYRNQGTGAVMWNCDVTFDGITFDHAAAASHSFDVQDVKSLTLKNCKIIGDGEYGLTSARGNGTGKSSIVGCTFENAAMQLLGNFATGLVIDVCTFNESRINVQAGNSVTVQNCNFKNTLTSANVDDSFYLIRSNSTPITVKGCNISIDSELTEVVTKEQTKWYILANRGTADWTVENVAVTMTDAALMQTQLAVTACTSTGKINTTNLTVNGNVQ